MFRYSMNNKLLYFNDKISLINYAFFSHLPLKKLQIYYPSQQENTNFIFKQSEHFNFGKYSRISVNRGISSNNSITKEYDEKENSITHNINEISKDVIEKIPSRSYIPINVLLPPSTPELVDSVAPQLKPTFNISAYADISENLKQFIDLGVEISKWEENTDICLHILRMDFEEDIKPYIFFIHKLGIAPENLGKWFTANPFIFQESLENLHIRINYLESKKFKPDEIGRIIEKTPKWINHSTVEIDAELGIYQRKFKLSGNEVRSLVINFPKQIVYTIKHKFLLERKSVVFQDQLGFTFKETKKILLAAPKIFRIESDSLCNRFDILHNEIGWTHEEITSFPWLLDMPERKINERHKFLKFFGKNQFDSKKPNFISSKDFCSGSDVEFAQNVANVSVDVFNDFLKTL